MHVRSPGEGKGRTRLRAIAGGCLGFQACLREWSEEKKTFLGQFEQSNFKQASAKAQRAQASRCQGVGSLGSPVTDLGD